jgi:leucyl-tRNA synthetase
VHRFLGRVSRLGTEVAERIGVREPAALDPERLGSDALELARKAHWAVERVTEDIHRFHFNTALSALMELVNDAYRLKDSLYGDEGGEEALTFAAATVSSLLFQFAPHLGAEVYEQVTGGRIWEAPWPAADARFLVRDSVELVVQVNGKVRDRIQVAAEAEEDQIKRDALQRPNVQRHLDGKQVVKEIVVPGKLVNFVVR